MLITNIKYTKDGKYVTLSADIIFENGKKHNMFFQVDKTYDRFLVRDASPFLSSLLLTAMKTGEDILIDGSVPRRVVSNAEKVMKLISGWKIGLSKIKIKSAPSGSARKNPKYVGCFFTGGVDSFYTYLKNKKSITHLITIHGCDIALSNTTFFAQTIKVIRKIAFEENKKIVMIRSNYREIIEPILEWEWNLGSALAATALLLSSGFKKVYIPSGMKKTQLVPYGTHPDLDPLWSTQTLKLIHDGCEYGRLEKVLKSISKSSLALKYLRVCCHTLKSKYNCNECFKCLQTKIDLYCAGALDKSETFSHSLDTKLVEKIYYNNSLNFNIFGEESLAYLIRKKLNPQLQEAIKTALYKSKNPSLLRKTANVFAYWDKKYNERRIYTQICQITPDHDRTLVFKVIRKLGLFT